MDQVEWIAVLDNEVEAQLLDAELTERGIPHLLRSYYDSAYNGIFQFSQGWGHVEAPSKYKDEILQILNSMRQDSLDSESD